MSKPDKARETNLRVEDRDKENDYPPKGYLETLPTKAETQARFKPIQVYVTNVPARRASHALKYN